MHVKIEARILIFPGTDFYFPSTSVPPGTFLGSVLLYTLSQKYGAHVTATDLSSNMITCALERSCELPASMVSIHQTCKWVIGSPGRWVIWVIYHVRVTGSLF